jgi:hypothetical protein
LQQIHAMHGSSFALLGIRQEYASRRLLIRELAVAVALNFMTAKGIRERKSQSHDFQLVTTSYDAVMKAWTRRAPEVA